MCIAPWARPIAPWDAVLYGRSASQECETETVVLVMQQLYTSLLVSTETNREASEGASIFCYAQFC